MLPHILMMPRILDKHESLTLAFCESFWEFSEKTVFGQTSLRDSFFNGLEFIQKRQIYGNCIVNASSVLFRKKFLSNIPTDYQDFQGSGDYILWSYLCELGNIFYTTKRLNHFRRHESATTSKCIATGRSFFENHRIYNYFKSKGYVSNFAHYRIVNYELKQIELNKDVLIKNNVYSQCKSLWENEKRIGNLISSLLTFFAKQINEYSNLPFHAKIWKFFHLPDTNIRGKLFRRR